MEQRCQSISINYAMETYPASIYRGDGPYTYLQNRGAIAQLRTSYAVVECPPAPIGVITLTRIPTDIFWISPELSSVS